jgi:anti-sigma regulatory factor (Ser/Thr protein kinase)
MRIELDNALEELPPVVALLEEYCGAASLDAAMLQAAELALDELLTNIISYAYPDSSQHRIIVDLSVESSAGHNAFKIVVSDDGVAFNPFQQADPAMNLSIEEQKLGGVGIHLVKKFMDDYSYQRIDGRNVVTLLKYLDQD